MDIIIVSSRLSKARSYTVTRTQLAFFGLLGAAAVVSLAVVLNVLSLRYAVSTNSPMLQAYLEAAQAQQNRKTQSYLRDSLNAMASKLGEMQAQLMQLNTLGERVSKLAGVKPQELQADPAAGRGGALVTTAPEEMSLDDLRSRIDQFSRQMDAFTGANAFHEGVDFVAEPGTPILAAAGGVVVTSEEHPQYGNMVEIDHGNGLITRYGHASRRSVKVGDVVLRGAKIGEVGSTGRSTGPHLHFEVRINGAAQNPARFFQPPG
jgi:murein DD-endopeptidase MepM/ murein hydrolase activator NlpD